MELDDSQLHTLRHMLGINTPNDKHPKPYRNYAAVTPGDPEFQELQQMGMVERYMPIHGSEYHWYRCTGEGYLAAMDSHKRIRRTRSQRMYSRFLAVRDTLPNLTFREFLTSSKFADIRREVA